MGAQSLANRTKPRPVQITAMATDSVRVALVAATKASLDVVAIKACVSAAVVMANVPGKADVLATRAGLDVLALLVHASTVAIIEVPATMAPAFAMKASVATTAARVVLPLLYHENPNPNARPR